MAGFIPAIHDFGAESKTWMAATGAAMTVVCLFGLSAFTPSLNVMAGFIPAIHDFGAQNKTWMVATSAAMTVGGWAWYLSRQRGLLC